MSNGNKFKTILIIISLICSFYLLFSFNLNFALSETVDVGLRYGEQTGLGAEDVRITIAKIIRVVLGILGIVFVTLIIYAGTLYMGSKGDPEKLDSARKIFISAIIGLAIILASYSLASYILSKLLQATGVEIVGNGESINQNINNGWPDGSDEADGEDMGLPVDEDMPICLAKICTDSAELPGFPIRAYDEQGEAKYYDAAVIATDGQYLYTRAWNWKSTWRHYGGNIPGTHGYNIIYKIGTGFGNTNLGEIVEQYVWRDRYDKDTGEENELKLTSMTYHKDGHFYAGRQSGKYEEHYINRIVFSDAPVANPYTGQLEMAFWFENVLLPQFAFLYDIHGWYVNPSSITSNGDYLFTLGPEGVRNTNPTGVKIKVFTINGDNITLVKDFIMPNDPEGLGMPEVLMGFVAVDDIIYIIPWVHRGKITAINWRTEEWLEAWWSHNNITHEANGQYDWVNDIFWIGEHSRYHDLSNKIHAYSNCQR